MYISDMQDILYVPPRGWNPQVVNFCKQGRPKNNRKGKFPRKLLVETLETEPGMVVHAHNPSIWPASQSAEAENNES